jgi:hypothetical protein
MNATILIAVSAILILFGVIYYFTRDKPKEPRYEYATEVPVVASDTTNNEENKKILDLLIAKNKQMEEEDAKLKSQIALLQIRAGIESEQTKYLTANVNRTLSTV